VHDQYAPGLLALRPVNAMDPAGLNGFRPGVLGSPVLHRQLHESRDVGRSSPAAKGGYAERQPARGAALDLIEPRFGSWWPPGLASCPSHIWWLRTLDVHTLKGGSYRLKHITDDTLASVRLANQTN
jgi:hypothetical protein